MRVRSATQQTIVTGATTGLSIRLLAISAVASNTAAPIAVLLLVHNSGGNTRGKIALPNASETTDAASAVLPNTVRAETIVVDIQKKDEHKNSKATRASKPTPSGHMQYAINDSN